MLSIFGENKNIFKTTLSDNLPREDKLRISVAFTNIQGNFVLHESYLVTMFFALNYVCILILIFFLISLNEYSLK